MQRHPVTNVQRDRCEGKGASASTETPRDDKPGLVAEEPEHCFACFRLIRPGQTYCLTIEHEVLCANCALVEEAIRVRDDLAVVVEDGRLLVRRGDATVEVLPGEVRRLVDALVEGAAGLVDGQTRLR